MDNNNLFPIQPQYPWLAPLAGFSDLPFRLLCREMGASVACTEMVSAKGLIYGLKKKDKGSATEDILVTSAEDSPLVVQLFGEDPEFISQAVEVLRERGYSHFDLNMGCSVPKVCKSGAGAALLRDPRSAVKVAAAMIDAAGEGRAGCKIRLGWDAAHEVYLELAKALEDAGSAWITLHPRYARQGFSGKADMFALEKLVSELKIPVIASGDLFTAEDGIAVLETGVSSVMFARGALINPAIFRAYRQLHESGACSSRLMPGELLELIRRHAKLARLHCPEYTGRKRRGKKNSNTVQRDHALVKMRTVVPRYVRHLTGVKHLRNALTRCENWEEFEKILASFFTDCSENKEENQAEARWEI